MRQPLETHCIPSTDGQPVIVTVYGGSNVGPVLVVNPATAVPQRFYAKFGAWLASYGVTVVTFDYRGIGQSLSRPIKGFPGSMKDWAKRDAQAVADWASATYSGRKLFGLGHSFGGQAFGLMQGNDRYSGVILVAAQSGYWRLFARRRQLRSVLMWYLVAPLLCRLLGYFPSKAFGLGEPMPAGVMRQWAAWCRHPDYLMSEFEKGEFNQFLAIRCPIAMVEIEDDAIAPRKAVDALKAYLPQGRVHHFVARADSPIGHFGLFREPSKGFWGCVQRFVLTQEPDAFTRDSGEAPRMIARKP